MKKHKYGNATTEDLWDALSDASNIPVADNMALWIKTMGYPVLTVAEEMDGIGIEQSRFISTGNPPTLPSIDSQAMQNQKKMQTSGGSLSV